MRSLFGVTVPRLCRIRSGAVADEQPFPLDPDGFLDEAAAGPSTGDDGEMAGRLVPLREALRDGGALLLLGEPGLGKTTELRRLGHPTDGLGMKPVEADGAEITDTATFDELVGQHLRALPARAAAPGGAADLLVVIDQVDESPIVGQLAGYLRRALDGRDTAGLRLVLGCRTADLPHRLTVVLNQAFGSCVVADLAPLSRSDATSLAASVAGVDGAALVAAAADLGAGALANVPLTLELLVRVYRDRGDLGAPPARLFADGVLHLLDEGVPTAAGDESTPAQRRAVAERIAARLVLSGRRTIWRGRVLDAGDQDVDASSLAGVQESCETGPFEVTPRIVTATLGTGLFTGRGEDRLAFRHASFAAYLAARYLVRRRVPPIQLQQLFLIPAGGAARIVPTALRETAAWLVAATEVDTHWLIKADPESIVPHTALVESSSSRRDIVAALLERADEIEVSRQTWARSIRHLAHPGLDAQLLAVLETPGAVPADGARIRLAVRLAREVTGSALVDPLLVIAENDAWDASTRVLAATAAFDADPDAVASRLRALLSRLADSGLAASTDPHDELRGTLLRLLWPGRLPTAEALPALSNQPEATFFGAYRMFHLRFAQQLPEGDIDTALTWAMGLDADDNRNEDLLSELVDRALSAPRAKEHVPAVAALLHRQHSRYRRPALPRALNLVDEHGDEPDDVRALRRALAVALIERAVDAGRFGTVDIYTVLGRWSRGGRLRRRDEDDGGGLRRGQRWALLDTGDLSWIRQLAADAQRDGRAEPAEALATAAAWVSTLDQPPPDAAESDDDEDEVTPPETVAAFREQVTELFSGAEAGAPGAFWRLAYLLQCEPESTKGTLRFDDDLLDFPAAILLPDDHPDRLADAALRYVADENDHGDEWMSEGVRDNRAWAGYLALALLQRRGRLDEVPDARWAHWVHALVAFMAVSDDSGGREVKRHLLKRAGRHAAEPLAAAVRTYVRSRVARGQLPSETDLIDPAWAPPFTDTWAELVADLTAAITGSPNGAIALTTDEQRAIALTQWEAMLSALMAMDDPRGIALATGCLRPSGSSEPELVLAGRAGSLLLHADAAAHLPDVMDAATASPAVGREIALAAGQRHDAQSILEDLDVKQLAAVFRWLSAYFPPEDDRHEDGVHSVTPEEQAREWRDRVADFMVTIGTREAVETLAALYAEAPRPHLLFCLVRCRALAASGDWRAPRPQEIAELLDDAARRLARTDVELRDVLVEVLREMEQDLAGHGDLLWDLVPKRFMPAGTDHHDHWLPKSEYALQAYVAHELDLRLVRRGIIVNREVLVHVTNARTGAGERTDIQVEASAPFEAASGPAAKRVAVVIEIKGCWNDEVPTAQRTQLAERYLRDARSNAGIYLVGLFPQRWWTAKDHRRRADAARNAPDSLPADLAEQATAIAAELNVSTVPIILTVPLALTDPRPRR